LGERKSTVNTTSEVHVTQVNSIYAPHRVGRRGSTRSLRPPQNPRHPQAHILAQGIGVEPGMRVRAVTVTLNPGQPLIRSIVAGILPAAAPGVFPCSIMQQRRHRMRL
jgi:hypothetical protein